MSPFRFPDVQQQDRTGRTHETPRQRDATGQETYAHADSIRLQLRRVPVQSLRKVRFFLLLLLFIS